MKKRDLMEVMVQERRMYLLLNEVLDLSVQLADAVDRGDEVTTGILLSMRQDPINRLMAVRRALQELREGMPREEAEQLSALLNGAPADGQEERMISLQAADNQKLYQKTLELDKRLSRKVTGKETVYGAVPD